MYTLYILTSGVSKISLWTTRWTSQVVPVAQRTRCTFWPLEYQTQSRGRRSGTCHVAPVTQCTHCTLWHMDSVQHHVLTTACSINLDALNESMSNYLHRRTQPFLHMTCKEDIGIALAYYCIPLPPGYTFRQGCCPILLYWKLCIPTRGQAAIHTV